jgi:tyrosine-protein phosphatase SIW14
VRARTRVNSLSLLFVLGMGIGVAQETKPTNPPTQRQMGSRKEYVGLPNFAQVSPRLFRGGQPGADGLTALKKMGVSIIVDMRGNKSSHEQIAVEKLGMQYIAIPWHCPFPTDPIFARFLRLIHDNPKKKVFVHCRLGDDRTGMAIAAYRMADEGWSPEDALKEMREFGFKGPHRFICPTLLNYEKRFPKHLKDNPVFQGLVRPAPEQSKK